MLCGGSEDVGCCNRRGAGAAATGATTARRKEHTYTATPLTGTAWPLNPECSELSADEAVTVGQVLMFAGAVIPLDRGVTPASPPTITEVRALDTLVYPLGPDRAAHVAFFPILPHGDYVGWAS